MMDLSLHARNPERPSRDPITPDTWEFLKLATSIAPWWNLRRDGRTNRTNAIECHCVIGRVNPKGFQTW